MHVLSLNSTSQRDRSIETECLSDDLCPRVCDNGDYVRSSHIARIVKKKVETCIASYMNRLTRSLYIAL